MKKSCLLAALCLALIACPVMAEETEKTPSLIEEVRTLIEAEDYEAAVPILQEAADIGDAEAQNMLGNCYMYGLGIEQDEEEAAKYYQLSADQGNIPAAYNLAFSYLNGKGVEQDLKTAEEWYQKALDAGYEPDDEDQKHIAEVMGEDSQNKEE